MKNLSKTQVRELRNKFWQSKNHKEVKPVSLVADSSNKTVLFNVAGMQQLVPYLIGKDHPNGKRLFNIQKCLRTNDIDDIGDERHCSMFEMMGNRSLGDYFKKESLEWTIEFLTSPEYLDIDINKIGGTIFAGGGNIPRDDESFTILQSLGIKNITEFGFDENGESDNFWTPGAIGPCGPSVEFFYDRGEEGQIYIDPITGKDMLSDRKLGINDRYTEIWNNVFMAYYRDNGKITELTQKNVDTGQGLERLCMVLQRKETIFDTDIYNDYKYILEGYSDSKYTDNPKPYCIIMDHIRASTFLIADGILPSNEGRGYVLRRLIRRMYYNLDKITMNSDDIYTIIETLVTKITDEYSKYYDWQENSEYIYNIIKKECQGFQKTIVNGIGHFENLIKNNKDKIAGSDAFKLYDTYGLPWDIVKDLANENNIYVSYDDFEKELEKSKELARKGANFAKGIDRSRYINGLAETQFVGYNSLELEGFVLLKDFVTEENNQRCLVFDKTVFYAEGGGQKGDSGEAIINEKETVNIIDTIKFAGVYIHIVG